MPTVGVLTIGQAPRPDRLGYEVQAVLGDGYRMVERGALDDLDRDQVRAIAPGPKDYHLVTLLRDGTPVQIAKRAILAHLQRQIDRLEEGDGVTATLLLCTGAFPVFRARRPLIQPQAALCGIAIGLAGGPRIAVMIPAPEQRPQAEATWRERGVDPLLIVADPYGSDPCGTVRRAAEEARDAALIFMDCFGYSLAMQEAARSVFPGPVLLARSLAARLLAEVAW